jgi:mannose-6-phosphate isomerase-like protein (cupin superfamily)
MTTGRLLLESADGARYNELVAGRSYARDAGIEHDVINDGTTEFVFIEIEQKPS